MQFIIVLNIIPIVLDFAVDETWSDPDGWWRALEVGFVACFSSSL